MTHFDDWELLAFLSHDDELVDVAALEVHLAGCLECREQTEQLREFSRAISDPSLHREPARRVREIAESFLRDDGHSATEVARLLALPLESWSAAIARHPEWHNEHFCGRLLDEARGLHERDPGRALAVTDAARSVADRLSDARALAAQRAAVARERAHALRFLGRFDEAITELEWAERFLAHVPVPDFDLAFVNWTRAIVYLHMTRYPQALDAARAAIHTFRQYGDFHRATQVSIVEAGILYDQGDVAAASQRYRQLAHHFREAGDRLAIARVEANLAACSMSLDDYDAVRAHGENALTIFSALGVHRSEELRVRWTLASALLRQGRLDEALDALQKVREDFESLGMKGEAAEALLEVIEVHVLRKEWEAAFPLSRQAVASFREMNAPLHVADAVAYLEQAIRSSFATGELVTYVREQIRRPEAAAFTPPITN